eukprot:1152881-Pelagomonas_calceolata.AAC.9
MIQTAEQPSSTEPTRAARNWHSVCLCGSRAATTCRQMLAEFSQDSSCVSVGVYPLACKEKQGC